MSTGYRALFANREFCALYVARTASLLGDQLARVVLAVLVFDETGSAFVTALVYALTFLPYVVGLFLAGLADRRPRRTVMICGDLIGAAAVGLMALPGLPLVVLSGLLVLAMIVSPVYDAARAALLPEVLEGDLYVQGSALTTMTFGAVQVLGFGLGGALIAGVGAHLALALDAGTFLGSAALLRWRTTSRVAANAAARPWEQLVGGARLVFGTPALRQLVWLAWLNAFWIVPEGLAAPYAHDVGAGAVGTGLLLAAAPLGSAAGSVVLARFVSESYRARITYPLATLAATPLLVMALRPGLPATLLLWVISGVGASYNLPANTAFMRALPNARRGQAFALVSTGMVTGQGLAVVVAGAVASVTSPAAVIAVAGGLALAVLSQLVLAQHRRPTDDAAFHPIGLPKDGWAI